MFVPAAFPGLSTRSAPPLRMESQVNRLAGFGRSKWRSARVED
jgi:hypothetical protein